MRRLSVVAVVCLNLTLAACGGDDPSSSDSQAGATDTAAVEENEPKVALNSKEARRRSEPNVRIPDGPPPRKVVARDLKKGTGAPLVVGPLFTVNYVSFDYRTGKKLESSWDLGEPSLFSLGREEVIEGWEQGLKGMRVGGRRELIVPSELAYESGPLVYVIDLLSVEEDD